MVPRRMSLALVLALLAGMMAVSRPQVSRRERGIAIDAGIAAPQLRRAGKSCEAPDLATRRISLERPLAVPPSIVIPTRRDVVVVLERIAAPSLLDHAPEPIALARAPPPA